MYQHDAKSDDKRRPRQGLHSRPRLQQVVCDQLGEIRKGVQTKEFQQQAPTGVLMLLYLQRHQGSNQKKLTRNNSTLARVKTEEDSSVR